MLNIYLCAIACLISVMESDCSKLEDFQNEYYSAKGSMRKLARYCDGTYSLQVQGGQNTFTMGEVQNVENADSQAQRIYIARENVLVQVLWRDTDELPNFLKYEFSDEQLKIAMYSLVIKKRDTFSSTEPSGKDCSKLDDFQKEYHSAEGSIRKLVKNVDGTYSLHVQKGQNTFKMGVVQNVANKHSSAKRVYIERDNVLLQVLWKDENELPNVLRYEFSDTQLKMALYIPEIKETDTLSTKKPSEKR